MNNRQEQILKLYKSADDGELIDYYGSLQGMLDVKKSINQLDYDADKITLAQMALDFKLASKLISDSITDYLLQQLVIYALDLKILRRGCYYVLEIRI